MSVLKGTKIAWILIIALAVVLIVMSRFARPFVYVSGDIDIYQSIGEYVWGSTDTLKSEYPSLASALFALLHPPAFGAPFPDAWSAFLVLVCLTATAWAAWACSAREGCFFLLSIIATMLLLGLDVTWGRFDVLVGTLLLLTWLAHRRGKFATCGFFLIVAAGMKLIPLVLLPFLYAATPKASLRPLMTGVFAGVLLVAGLPLLVLGPVGTFENSLYMVLYHAQRGVQLESTWSGLTILWEVLHGRRATMLFAFRSHVNIEVPAVLPLLGMVLGTLGLLGIFWKRRNSGNTALVFLCILCWLLFFSPVLSPQYITWFLPLLLAWGALELTGGKTSLSTVLILCVGCAVALLTNWFYLPLYLNLVDKQDLLPTLVLNLRNALLFVFAWLCYRATKTPSPSGEGEG